MKCPKCLMNTKALYFSHFSYICKECIESEIEIKLAEDEYFICDECGKEYDVIYCDHDNDIQLCPDCWEESIKSFDWECED